MAEKIAEASILEVVADWQVARLKAMLSWAENDRDNLFGNREDVIPSPPTEAIQTMCECQERLAEYQPRTAEGARVMLLVVREILAHQVTDPERESIMSLGPLLEIVRAVEHALHCAPPGMVLRKAG
jgi:hypothetical protein